MDIIDKIFDELKAKNKSQVVYLLLSEIIMIPLSIVINALLKHGQDGKYWGAFALAAVITWVEYYVIRNLFHLASVWLMKGV